MFELIKVTAEYSNAVLVAVLPCFSDFAKQVEIPIPVPIAMNQVQHFVCDPRYGHLGGYLTLTNGCEFWFDHGFVEGFRTPRSYFNLQDPALIPKFYGPLRLNKDEALKLARGTIIRLGYSLHETYADQEPEITLPLYQGTNVVPHYRFVWKNPIALAGNANSVDIEVDAAQKRIQMLRFLNDNLWRNPPRTSVQPILLNQHPLSLSASNSLVKDALPKISELVQKLQLPMTLPLSSKNIEELETDDEGTTRLVLTNGYTFECETTSGMGLTFSTGIAYRTPDSLFYWNPLKPRPPIEKFLGKWKMSDEQAVTFARGMIRKAGYTEKQLGADQAPDIQKAKQVGTYIIPRLLISWKVLGDIPGSLVAEAVVEVDADSGTLKYIRLHNGVIESADARKAKANVPRNLQMIFQTNAPAHFPGTNRVSPILRGQVNANIPVTTNRAGATPDFE